MKFLIAGLGNIGPEYVETRHNIGFDVVDVFATRHKVIFSPARLADLAQIKFKGRSLLLIKPTTYMNLSGKAIKYWMEREQIPLDRLLVIYDDLAFPLDVLKVRVSGSDGGHNGLKSIQECVGSQQYARIRFGIGNEFRKGQQVDFVLGRWQDNEIPLVNQKVEACCNIIEQFVTLGPERTMNLCNQLKFTPSANSAL